MGRLTLCASFSGASIDLLYRDRGQIKVGQAAQVYRSHFCAVAVSAFAEGGDAADCAKVVRQFVMIEAVGAHAVLRALQHQCRARNESQQSAAFGAKRTIAFEARRKFSVNNEGNFAAMAAARIDHCPPQSHECSWFDPA